MLTCIFFMAFVEVKILRQDLLSQRRLGVDLAFE
jgi:hypothetical protein